MAIEVIHCPQCRAEVRVPETLFGTVVRCPRCRATFRAPVRDSDGKLAGIELLADAVEAMPAATGRNSLKAPAVLLFLVGLAGVLIDGFVVYRSSDPDAVAGQIHTILADPNHPISKAIGDKLKPEEFTPERIKLVHNGSAAFLAVSILVVLGALAMLRQRFWGFCILASVLAMVNLGSCCTGLPIGLWAMIRLFDPSVKMLFR